MDRVEKNVNGFIYRTISLWKSLQSQSSVLWRGFVERLETAEKGAWGGGGFRGCGEEKLGLGEGGGDGRERE